MRRLRAGWAAAAGTVCAAGAALLSCFLSFDPALYQRAEDGGGADGPGASDATPACSDAGTSLTIADSFGCRSQFTVPYLPDYTTEQRRACIALAPPYVFVGTTHGLVAYSIADGARTALPLEGEVSAMTVSGGRVFVVFAAEGDAAGPSRASYAVVDPAEPTKATAIATNVPSLLDVALFPGALGGAYLVVAAGDVSASVAALPASGGVTPAFVATMQKPGNRALAPSGDRLVLRTYPSDVSAGIVVVHAAGTSGQTIDGERNPFAFTGDFQRMILVGGTTGEVVGAVPSARDDAGAAIDAVRVFWVLDDDGDPAPKAAPTFDAVTFAIPKTASDFANESVGAVAWVGRRRVLAALGEPTGTYVALLARDGATIAAIGARHLAEPPRDVVPLAAGGRAFALVASGGGAYTLSEVCPR